MSKVLVIHPDDRSTDFLKRIYYDKNYDVINDSFISVKELKSEIKKHDKIIMMGHGTPYGLINPSAFGNPRLAYNRPYLIDYIFVDLLKDKETISIWCNSDQFFKRYNLINDDKPMLHTKMIISEVSEEYFVLGSAPLNSEEILENMNLFADAVHTKIDSNGQELVDSIINNYTWDDPVSVYNRESIVAF